MLALDVHRAWARARVQSVGTGPFNLRQCGNGPRLHDEELSVRARPFDVLGCAVMIFDTAPVRRPARRRRGSLSTWCSALLGRHRALLRTRGSAGTVITALSAVSLDTIGPVRFAHHNVVGIDRSADDGLPEAPGGADHRLSSRRPLLGLAVNMHPSGLGVDHLLNHDGEADR